MHLKTIVPAVALMAAGASAKITTVGECEKYAQNGAEVTLCFMEGGSSDQWTNEGQRTYKNGNQKVVNHKAVLTNTGNVPVCNLKVDAENADQAIGVWPEFLAQGTTVDNSGVETVFFEKTHVEVGVTLPVETETSFQVSSGFHPCEAGDMFAITEGGEGCEIYSQGNAQLSLCKNNVVVDNTGSVSVSASLTNVGPSAVCNMKLIAENDDKSFVAWPTNLIGAEKENDGMLDIVESGASIELGYAVPADFAESLFSIEQGFFACNEKAGKLVVEETTAPVTAAVKKAAPIPDVEQVVDLDTDTVEEESELVVEETEEAEIVEESPSVELEEVPTIDGLDLGESEVVATEPAVRRLAPVDPACEVFTEGQAEITLCLLKSEEEWVNEGQQSYKNGEQEVRNLHATVTNTGKVPVCNLKVDMENQERAFSVWPEFLSAEGTFEDNGMDGTFLVGNAVDVGLTLPKEFQTSLSISKGFHACEEGEQFLVANNGECDTYTQGSAEVQICNMNTIVDESGSVAYNAVLKNTGNTNVCNLKIQADNADMAYAVWPEQFLLNNWSEDAFGANTFFEFGLVLPEGMETQLQAVEGFYACDLAVPEVLTEEVEAVAEEEELEIAEEEELEIAEEEEVEIEEEEEIEIEEVVEEEEEEVEIEEEEEAVVEPAKRLRN